MSYDIEEVSQYSEMYRVQAMDYFADGDREQALNELELSLVHAEAIEYKQGMTTEAAACRLSLVGMVHILKGRVYIQQAIDIDSDNTGRRALRHEQEAEKIFAQERLVRTPLTPLSGVDLQPGQTVGYNAPYSRLRRTEKAKRNQQGLVLLPHLSVAEALYGEMIKARRNALLHARLGWVSQSATVLYEVDSKAHLGNNLYERLVKRPGITVLLANVIKNVEKGEAAKAQNIARKIVSR